jgi:Zn-dependent protease with chaperone function
LPSEVYLIGDANAYVADRGGLLGMGDRRVLCLGLPLLATLTVSELRAVLAHEFAHFYSGDTALGPWVFKAHTALVRSFQSLVGLRAKVGRIGAVQLLFALVILVLNHYFTFFLRVTNFISRQQEFRSDELACIVAGKWPCSRGLEKVHAAGMLWPAFWMGEVAPLLELKCIPDIGDGFRRFLASPAIAGFIEASLKAEQESKETDPFSSHPPFSERIEALRRMQLPQPEGDDALASSLFDDPQSLELMFIEKMNPNIPHNSLRRAPWNDLATLVTIPYWHSEIAKFGTLLLGKKAVALPELAKQLPQIGSHMPDPKGRLLTPAQRTERAEQLLSRAVGLLLLEKGWQLKREPAVAEFRRSDETVDPFALVADVVAGKVSAEEWASKCVALGIAEETLGAVSSQPVPSATA